MIQTNSSCEKILSVKNIPRKNLIDAYFVLRKIVKNEYALFIHRSEKTYQSDYFVKKH